MNHKIFTLIKIQVPESVHLSPEELGSSVFLSMDLSWSALELVHAHIAHRAVAPQPSPIAPKRCGNAPRRWDYQFVPDDLEVYPKSTPSKKKQANHTLRRRKIARKMQPKLTSCSWRTSLKHQPSLHNKNES